MKKDKFKHYDLTTQEGREKAIKDINYECHRTFVTSFRDIGRDAIFNVSYNQIEIGLKETNPESDYFGMAAFGSEVTIYDKQDNVLCERAAEMNYGSMGVFNPKSSPASYWRTIHAAALLRDWAFTEKMVNVYCREYKELLSAIDKANPKPKKEKQ